MVDLETLRAGVRQSLPEITEIGDPVLREKVVEAWAVALSETEFERIEDMPGTGGPGAPGLKRGSQVDHIRGTARMALGMLDGLERVVGPLGVKRDILLAAALCHDVGKPYEYSPRNRARWESDPGAAGLPAIRHPVYGVHIALTVGLPEDVVHTAGAHSTAGEGELVTRSLVSTIVQYADHAFWKIVERAGLLEAEMFSPETSFIKMGMKRR
jgi:putative nucleotidyltransferase with HDIG domain